MAINWHTLTAKPGLCFDQQNKRKYSSIKWIVIHYTAVPGDTARREALAFHDGNTGGRYAGAHVFVDDTEVWKSVPINRTAWAVGGNLYPDASQTGGGAYYGQCTNYNSISIEMCTTPDGGVSDATVKRTAELTRYYMEKYKIDADHVIRHFDVTGKNCPAPWARRNSSGWQAFQREIRGEGDFVVRVDGRIAIKPSPRLDGRDIGVCPPGSYTIVEVRPAAGTKKGFGKLKSGAGWINLDYAEKV